MNFLCSHEGDDYLSCPEHGYFRTILSKEKEKYSQSGDVEGLRVVEKELEKYSEAEKEARERFKKLPFSIDCTREKFKEIIFEDADEYVLEHVYLIGKHKFLQHFAWQSVISERLLSHVLEDNVDEHLRMELFIAEGNENPQFLRSLLEDIKGKEIFDNVVSGFSYNSACPPDILEEVFGYVELLSRLTFLSYNHVLPDNILDIWEKYYAVGSEESRDAVLRLAKNTHVSEQIFEQLLVRGYPLDEECESFLVSNPFVPESLVNKIFVQAYRRKDLKHSVYEDARVSENLLRESTANEDWGSVYHYPQLFSNPNMPEDVLRSTFDKGLTFIYYKIAQHPNTPFDVLEDLVKKRSVDYSVEALRFLCERDSKYSSFPFEWWEAFFGLSK